MRVKEPKATRATVPSTDPATDDLDVVDRRYSHDDEDTTPDGGPVFDSVESVGSFDAAVDRDLSMEPDLDTFDEPPDVRAIGEAVRQGTYLANPRAIAELMLAQAALKPTN